MFALIAFLCLSFGTMVFASAPKAVARFVGIGIDPMAPPTGLMRFALDLVGRVVIICLALAALILMFVGSASAQDVVQSAVDLGPLAHLAIEIVAPVALTVLSALAGWVMLQFKARTGLDIDARHRSAVEQGLDRAVDYAIGQLEDRIAGGIPFTSKSRAVTAAATYAKRAIPDALQYFQIDGERLSQMVEARLQAVLVDPETERAEPNALRAGRLK